MAIVSFPGSLRYFQWERGRNILPTMVPVQRRNLSRMFLCPKCAASYGGHFLPLLFALSLELFLGPVRSDVALLELPFAGPLAAVICAKSGSVTPYLRDSESLWWVVHNFGDYSKILGARLNITK